MFLKNENWSENQYGAFQFNNKNQSENINEAQKIYMKITMCIELFYVQSNSPDTAPK